MLDDGLGNRDCVVVVHSVVPNTPAHKAGLKMDDIIEYWDGTPLHSKADWINQVKNSTIGSTVYLSIVRDGSKMELALRIGAATRELGGVRKVASRSAVARGGPGIRSKSLPRR
mmetsp:Transcript_18265/g.32491  ORF Transcript_18265/g.32491 Transcript_18265/m.32491 type:complete len:114 (+) Transcript_18265:1289-1630(+)